MHPPLQTVIAPLNGFLSKLESFARTEKTSNPLRLLVFLCLSMLCGAFKVLCSAKNVAVLREISRFISIMHTKNANSAQRLCVSQYSMMYLLSAGAVARPAFIKDLLQVVNRRLPYNLQSFLSPTWCHAFFRCRFLITAFRITYPQTYADHFLQKPQGISRKAKPICVFSV